MKLRLEMVVKYKHKCNAKSTEKFGMIKVDCKGGFHMNEENRPFSSPADAEGTKANFDANQRKLHSEGASSLWRQVSNLLILVGVIALIIIIGRLL